MPYVRGRVIAEIESTGLPKRFLDVLLWNDKWSEQNLGDFDEVEVLREYLRSIRPPVCGIRVFVPATHARTIEQLTNLQIVFVPVAVSVATAETRKLIVEEELANAVQTSLACDADVLVGANAAWFPYAEDLLPLGVFLTDAGFLKLYCETFVKGHDAPWSFTTKIWRQPWNGFYHLTESRTLSVGMDFLHEAYKKKANAEAQETGRSLIHNRLPNICFTRDRLLFYDIQRMAAHRAKWKRQEFVFEVGYYLNFYYPLIFGGFDHTALLVNQCLQLGLAEKNVGATYQSFLDALKAKNARLYSLFTNPETVEFTKRIAYLRHFASHRGSLAPGKLIEKPDKELTDAEVDVMISEAGTDETLNFLPAGEIREGFRASVRMNFRMAYYEKEGKMVDGIVPIVIDGKPGFIRPALDTDWNFQKFMRFLNGVLAELKKCM